MKNKTLFNVSFFTSKGVKKINEDAGWAGVNKNGQCMAVLCDGIGSQDDSHIASTVVVETFRRSFCKAGKIRNPDFWFKRNLKNAHASITKKSQQNLQSKKIGTTLVVCLIKDEFAHVYNLGDSRAYRYVQNERIWEKITKDHNLYNHLIDNNADSSTFVQYKNSLLALTKFLEAGSNNHLQYDSFKVEMLPSDLIFIASDGVYNYMNVSLINELIKRNRQNAFDVISRGIVQEALTNKSNDNLTSIVIESYKANANKDSE